MSKVFPHSDKKGMDAALDLVDDTLAALRKRVEQREEKESRVRDASTNTTLPPPPPPPSSTTSKGSRKPRNKGVLIKRKSKYKAKRTKQAHNSSVQSQDTQREEKEAERVPQDYCKNCNPRSEADQGKTSNTRRKRASRPPSTDPKLPDVERVVWKPKQRNHRGRKESDSSQDCLCYDNSLCDDPCPRDLRERVICRHKTKHRQESQSIFQDCCLCHSDSCLPLRYARAMQSDSFQNCVREESGGRGKRGHSRRDESDSSCRSNPRKTHRAARSSHKLRQTAKGSYTDTSRSRERKIRDTDSYAQEQPKKVHTHPKPIDVDKQGYARPTQTSKQRVKEPQPKKEKENILPYIPCGAKSHSYHIGITAQQEIGRLLNQPPRDLIQTISKSSGQRDGAATTGLTQKTVQQAMENIHHHLKGHTEH